MTNISVRCEGREGCAAKKGAPEEAGGSGRHSSDFPCCSSWRSQRDHTFVITKSSGSGIVSNKDENKKGGGEAAEASAQTDLLAESDLKAAQYDYDGAVQLLKSDSSYDKNADFQAAVKKYEETRPPAFPADWKK